MTVDIVACGQSAVNWEQHDYSIGVNDAWKFGKPTDALLVCNRPEQFSKERLNTITNSKPKHFFSNSNRWVEYFNYFDRSKASAYKRLYSNHPLLPVCRFMQWPGTLYDNTVFYSNTSPLIAVSLAYVLGAKEIILWGVDFKTHHIYHEGSLATKSEVRVYLELIAALKEKGVTVYRGSDGCVFDELITKYATSTVEKMGV